MSATPKATPRELPEHVAESDEWKGWPRKTEAHLAYGARERQVTAFCRSGRFQVWLCPDGTLRLDPSQLEDEFGKPGVFSGRNRQPADKSKRAEKAAELNDLDESDPLPFLCRELVATLRETREEKTQVLKLVVDPMNAAIKLLQTLTDQAMARATGLEKHIDEVLILRAELSDMKYSHERQLARDQAAEARRQQVMGLLAQKAPAMLDKLFSGGDLASFLATLDPMVIETVCESGALTASQVETIRRYAPKRESPLNGAAHAQ